MRYLIGLLITIAVIIFVIIRLLTGGSNTPSQKAIDLASLATTDTQVRMVVDNPVQAVQTHRQIEVTVGRDAADFALYGGYNGDTVRSKTYPMNEAAYRTFLRSLSISGKYTQGNNDPALKDEQGYCALGDRYIFEIIDDSGNIIQHYWATTCGTKTFGGNTENVISLFQAQIPDYSELTKDVDL